MMNTITDNNNYLPNPNHASRGIVPFIFRVYLPDATNYWLVLVAVFDYSYAEVDWMKDSDLPDDFTYCPTVDLAHERHRFNTEQEALRFVTNWWKAQKLAE